MGLSWEELLRLAVGMEENGRDFYRTLAAGAKDPDTARILWMMAEEEEDHADVFRHDLPGTGGPLPEEAERYLETLLSGLSSRVPPEIGDPGQALALAVEMEKDSILFYTELAAVLRDERARRILDGILRAEKLHLVEVRERLEDEG